MTASLADISYEQGLQLLLLRKQAVDAGQLLPLPKSAFTAGFLISPNLLSKAANSNGFSGLGSLAGNGLQKLIQSGKSHWSSLDPASKNVVLSGLLGSGAGAVTGLGQAYASGEGNYLSNAIRGGLAGGAMGGGLGLALNPASADKIQAQTSAIYDAVKRQSKPATRQTQSKQPTPPVTLDQLLAAKRDAESVAPELIYGGLGAAGTAGTARLGAKLLQREFYDPTRLTEAVATHIGEIARGKGTSPQPSMTARKGAIGSLFKGNPGSGPAFVAALAAKPTVTGGSSVQKKLLERLSQQGHGVRSFGRSGIDPKTLQLAATALDLPEEQVQKMLLRGGVRGLRAPGLRGVSRLAPIAALLTAAGYGGSRLLDAYRNSSAQRQQAAGNYSNLLQQLIPGQTAGAP